MGLRASIAGYRCRDGPLTLLMTMRRASVIQCDPVTGEPW